MMDIEDYSLSDLKELSDNLSRENITMLLNTLLVPDNLCNPDCEGTEFLLALKKWNEFDPFIFYLSLNSVRPDLVQTALRISWLCVNTPVTRLVQPLSVKDLIEMLRGAISVSNLRLIHIFYTLDIIREEIRFENTMQLLLQKKLIQKDLESLSKILISVKLNDIALKLDPYKREFEHLTEHEFIHKFRKELASSAKQMALWESCVQLFLETQFRNVKQMLGNNDPVSLEKVYVDLTIVKQKPRPINFEDETTYNEIAYLRKIANKEVDIIPVDFTEELKSCDPFSPRIWCIIGNPGSGKTFLCNRTALRFGNKQISAFSYSLYIPCRNPNWHEMESSRLDTCLEINAEFICKWILLGLPIGADWTIELAKHITESDGEGLLLIIDSLDEFTKQVPFHKSLLFLLLTRQVLYRSYIILTSRPGAWTDVSTLHQLKIDSYYQVLGFSPEQRDLYFQKQFENESTKLERCKNLLYQHDEMKQLSMIPVNASLFAALLKSDDAKHIHTLTQLYYELILYLIRRQLCRMGLEELSNVTLISDFDRGVLDCLHRIGFIAYQGVAYREMVSEEKVPLLVGKVQKSSHYLGLVQEYLKENKMGIFTKVWSFSHLTIQEFIGAIWMSSCSWRDQCLSVRFIVHTENVFALFRMIVRFLCGLLSDQSQAVLYLLYKHVTPTPVDIRDIPKCDQLRLPSTHLFNYTGWKAFTEKFLQLSTLLIESNSDSIPTYFNECRRFLPNCLSFYIEQPVSPNEWICFLQALPLLNHINMIYFCNEYVTPMQFLHLLQSIKECSIECIEVKFSKLDNKEIFAYTNAISSTQLPRHTKLSFDLNRCKLTDCGTVESLFSYSANQTLSGLVLAVCKFSSDSLTLLANHLPSCENIMHMNLTCPDSEHEVLLSALSSATRIIGLHLYSIPPKCHQQLSSLLPRLSQIRELTLYMTINAYSLLTHITHISNISYLHIQSPQQTRDISVSTSLLQMLHLNRHSIKGLAFHWLGEDIGFSSWDRFLNCLRSCSNLVQLELKYIKLKCNDETLWCSAFSRLACLVYLSFFSSSLSDSINFQMCKGLFFHRAIRRFELTDCDLGSDSCITLKNLIPTMLKLEFLQMADFLNKPDPVPVKLLKRTAHQYSIQHDIRYTFD